MLGPAVITQCGQSDSPSARLCVLRMFLLQTTSPTESVGGDGGATSSTDETDVREVVNSDTWQ